jgi:hypothetical protein
MCSVHTPVPRPPIFSHTHLLVSHAHSPKHFHSRSQHNKRFGIRTARLISRRREAARRCRLEGHTTVPEALSAAVALSLRISLPSPVHRDNSSVPHVGLAVFQPFAVSPSASSFVDVFCVFVSVYASVLVAIGLYEFGQLRTHSSGRHI